MTTKSKNYWHYVPLIVVVLAVLSVIAIGLFSFVDQKRRYVGHLELLSQHITERYHYRIMAGEYRDFITRMPQYSDVVAVDVLDVQCKSMLEPGRYISLCDKDPGVAL